MTSLSTRLVQLSAIVPVIAAGCTPVAASAVDNLQPSAAPDWPVSLVSMGTSALGLFAASLFLFAVGFLVARLAPGLWFAALPSATAHHVFVGQMVFISWVYVRSIVNHLIGAVVPIGWLDWLAMVVLTAGLVHLREGLGTACRAFRNDWRTHAVTLACIGLLLVVISYKELPRLVMLSSDPDQHAFFAVQLQRFGTIPYFSQFYWGTTDFRYPAGFAVLNFVWAGLSGAGVRDVVTVQGLIQVQLAILALFEAVAPRDSLRPRRHVRTGAAFVLLLFTFYRLLPFGYQESIFHLEGAGRTGGIGFAALSLSFALTSSRRIGDVAFVNGAGVATNAMFAGCALAVAALLNPASAAYPALLFVSGATILLVQRFSPARVARALLAAPPLALVFLDPYYLQRLLYPSALQSATLARAAAPTRPFVQAWGSAVHSGLVHPVKMLADTFRTDLLTDGMMGFLLLLLVAAIVGLVLLRAIRLRDAVVLAAFAGFLALARFMLFPLTTALGQGGQDLYLLPRYVESNRQQFVILWLYATLALVFLGGALRFSARALGGSIVCVVLALILTENALVPTTHRAGYPGNLGTVTADDLDVITAIEEQFGHYRREHGTLTFEQTPKILVLNAPAIVNGEKWLFPYGASRVLPLYDVYPVAFFYFQGNKEYTFDNYVAHVCTQFDAEWIAKQGIRYLFIPADFGNTCIANNTLPPGAHILIRKNRAALIELGRREAIPHHN